MNRIFALFVAVSAINAQNGGKPAGYVFGLTGEWVSPPGSNTLIRLGQAIYPGQKLQARGSNTVNRYLAVGRLDGDAPWTQECKAATCPSVVFPQPKTQPEASAATRIWNSFGDLFSHNPPTVVFTMTRSAAGAQEAVAPLAGGRVDLAAALETVRAGRYQVELYALGPKDAPPILRAPLQWSPPSGGFVPAASLTPGVYQLALLDADEDPIGSRVAILIAPAENVARLRHDFQSAREISSAWGPEVRPAAVHYFLTAYLAELHRQSANRQ